MLGSIIFEESQLIDIKASACFVQLKYNENQNQPIIINETLICNLVHSATFCRDYRRLQVNN